MSLSIIILYDPSVLFIVWAVFCVIMSEFDPNIGPLSISSSAQPRPAQRRGGLSSASFRNFHCAVMIVIIVPNIVNIVTDNWILFTFYAHTQPQARPCL